MTRTSKSILPTLNASGAGQHVKGVNPEHDHDNAATDAAADVATSAAISVHEAKYHKPVDPPPIALPGAPSGVTALAGDTTALVSWTPPTTGGSMANGSYRIYLDGVKAAVSTTFPATLTGLTNGQTYVVTVSAVNVTGEGPQSGPTSVTPVKPPITPPPTDPVFLSRPSSPVIVRDGGANVNISNLTIQSGGGRDNVSGIGITIRNVNGVITLTDLDMADLIGGIYISQCTGTLVIRNVRERNIGNNTIGSGHSNCIQLAESSLEGTISGNKFLGGQTEDMLSTWHSGGRGSGHELVIEDNAFQGLVANTATTRAWISGSGTGTILSDTAAPGGYPKSGWIIVRRNTYLTPGQVGINLIDGPGLQVVNNVIYEQQRSGNNNAITTWAGKPQGNVGGNRYWVTKADGTHPDIWLAGGTPSITQNPGNIKDSTIDPNTLVITL